MGRGAYDTTGMNDIPRQRAEESETPYSICSAATPSIEEDHPLFRLKDFCLQVIMEAFMQAMGRKQDYSDSAEGIGSADTSFADPNDRPRKRSRLSDNVLVVTDEKQTQRALTKRRPQDRRLWLACPYAKKDPVRYRDCYRFFLGRIRDVKQHLTRCHRKPIYCPICNDTFEDEDEKDSHIRSRICSPNPAIVIEGISEKQKRELSQRVSSKMPEDQQWFAVFDILFAPHPRPRSPYRDRELSEDLCNFQDFMMAKGPTILAESLTSPEGMSYSNLPDEERGLAALKKSILEDGLNLIIERWRNDTATAAGDLDLPHSPPSSDSDIATQINRPQVEDESHKPDNQSELDCINPNLDSKRHGEVHHISVPLRQANIETGMVHNERVAVDTQSSLERQLTDPIPQPSLDCSVLFPPMDESLNLFDFDIPGWLT